MPYQHKDAAGKPYRPSNGTEGMIFQAEFCDRCERDRAFQDGTGDSCEIAANAVAFDLGESGYPKEWIHDDEGRPCCTAFVKRDDA